MERTVTVSETASAIEQIPKTSSSGAPTSKNGLRSAGWSSKSSNSRSSVLASPALSVTASGCANPVPVGPSSE
ncbi:Uncharacterised protein [Mycobacteroides abscessus subsp. abscessus]|nr:Uncharacterised protein [Mycobacteroides abscessus subsp. abscessus]SKV43277.1 Uncharacterised protein [Mycobacteroides abscessus subsp. abscessus]